MNDRSPADVALPDGWLTSTIGAVTSKVGSGATPRGGAAVYVDEGTALIRSQNIHDNEFRPGGLAFINDDAAIKLKGVTVQAGDVLMNITGDSILRTCQAPTSVLPARVNQHVAIIRANGGADPRFIQKWLTLPAMKEYMLGHSSGGTRKAVTKAHIEGFPLPLPPVAEQKAIGRMLGLLDDKILSNARSVAATHALLDGLSAKLGAGLPLVPLGALAEQMKQTINPANLGEAEVDHFSLPAFDDVGTPERIPASDIMSNKLHVASPAVLVSRLNPRIDRTWWARPSTGVVALASTEFLVLSAPSPLGLAAAWLAVRDGFFRSELQRRVTGTSGSHQRVRPDDALAIDVPDYRTLDAARLEGVSALLESAHHKHLESERLRQLRDDLSPALLTGGLRVPTSWVAEEDA